MPDLSVIVVSWNTRELLRSCLQSVFAESTGLILEVFVVDNASTDGSAAMVRESFPQAQLIESAENLGFAGGNNLVLPLCAAPNILLLNSDAILLDTALRVLLTFLAEHSDVAAVGPKLIHPRLQLRVLGCGGQPTLGRVFSHYFFLARLFPNIRAFEGLHCYLGVHDRVPRSVGWMAGTCLMVRRDVVDRVGGLNERWFMYAEDVEWCARILTTGLKIYQVPAAVVEHHAGASTEQHVDSYALPIKASRDLFVQINQPSRLKLLLHDVIRVCGLAIRSAGYFLRSIFADSKQAPMWRSKALTYSVYSRVAAGYPPRRTGNSRL